MSKNPPDDGQLNNFEVELYLNQYDPQNPDRITSLLSSVPVDLPGICSAWFGGLPSRIEEIVVVPKNNSAYLNWSAPSDNGGSAISNYTIYQYDRNATLEEIYHLGNVTSFLVENLTNGFEYQFEITASNVNGESLPSSEISIIPYTFPEAPLNFTCSIQENEILLEWEIPVDSGGMPLLGFNLYYNVSFDSVALVESGINATSFSLENWVNGTYSFIITSVTVAGESIKNSSLICDYFYEAEILPSDDSDTTPDDTTDSSSDDTSDSDDASSSGPIELETMIPISFGVFMFCSVIFLGIMSRKINR